jgi:hypothetical protein
VAQTVGKSGLELLIFVVPEASERGLSEFQRHFGAKSVDRRLAWRPNTSTPRTEGPGGLADREGSTMTKSKVMVWLLIALGVVSGVAGAIILAVAQRIWATPRKELLALDIDRGDYAAVMVYRGVPLLLLSVLILASTSIVVAAKKA